MHFARFPATILTACAAFVAADGGLRPKQDSGETMLEHGPAAEIDEPISLSPNASVAAGAGRRQLGPNPNLGKGGACGKWPCGPDDLPWDPYWAVARMNSISHPPSPDAWKGKVDASGVKVYIIDTGIDFQDGSPFEYEFTGVINKGSDCHWSCDNCGNPLVDERPIDEDTGLPHAVLGTPHGTHVASNACGNYHGLAENCELCSVKILRNGEFYIHNMIEGFRHVIRNCNVAAGERCVINASLGVRPFDGDSEMKQVVAEAVAAGIVIVAAAGNEGEETTTLPQILPGVISVGGIKRGDEPWEDTNYGDAVTVYAPAKLVFGADPESNMFQSGTSFAAPFVAALAAGLLHNCVPSNWVRVFIDHFSTEKGFDPRSGPSSTRSYNKAAGIANTQLTLADSFC